MVSPNDRNTIIRRINSGEIDTDVSTGQRNKWWKKKHHPEREIPTNIYLLGDGTPKELHDMYNTKYTLVASPQTAKWENFRNYTRELVQQGIMV